MAKKTYKVTGDKLLEKMKQIIHEGNVRRVRLVHDGKTLMEIPLTVGAPAAAVGILAAPVLAAIGAVAALVSETTIEVEKVDEGEGEEKKS